MFRHLFALIITSVLSSSFSNSMPNSPRFATTIASAQPLPVLILKASPATGTVPVTVSFIATCSTCVAYTWDFGDGTIQTTPGPNQTHIYQSAGTYYPAVSATDANGNPATASAVIDATLEVTSTSCGKPFFLCMNRTTASIPTPDVPPYAGGPGGANTYMVDPDFHNIIVRATDYTHTITPGRAQWDGNYFQAGCGGGSFCNASNTDRTLWALESADGSTIMLRFDPKAFASAVAMIRNAGDIIPPNLPQSVFGLYTTEPTGYKVPKGRFSWKQRNLYYSSSGTQVLAYCFGISYVNGVCSDTFDGVNPPSAGNGRVVTLVDFADAGPNCLPADYTPTWSAFGDQDELTDGIFSVAFSSKNEGYPGQTESGQNTGVHAAVWSAQRGCQILNTYTGLFTADPGWGTNGMILSIPDRFTLHTSPNLDLSGTYMSLPMENCLVEACGHGSSGAALTLGTATAFYLCAPGHGDCGGHSSFGWSYWQNAAANTFPGQYDVRPLPNTIHTYTRTPSVKVAGVLCHGDSHMSWIADDPTNITNFLSVDSASTVTPPVTVCNDASPLRNELQLYDPAGGPIGRAGHTFNSGYSGRFSIQWAISEWTMMGDFAAWSSDWLETLGDENGNATCPGGLFRFPNWKAHTALAANTLIFPQAGNAAGYLFKVTVAGTSGSEHPAWPQTIGAAITDGSIQLVNEGSGCRGDVFITDLTTAY